MAHIAEVKQVTDALEKQGVRVQLLPGPQGFRYHMTLANGDEFQFDGDQLCELQRRGKPSASGIRELAKEIQKANER
jgi:hypothetical protein